MLLLLFIRACLPLFVLLQTEWKLAIETAIKDALEVKTNCVHDPVPPGLPLRACTLYSVEQGTTRIGL